MKKLTLIVLLFYPLLASPAPAPLPLAASDAELEQARQRLVEAEERADWEAAAVALLSVLDRSGHARDAEALWLVSHLLETFPDDPELLWRRAASERRAGDNEAALSDLLHLVEVAPSNPLGVRARRTLPAMYLTLGLVKKSAEADEALIRDGLADRVAVLTRLAKTYSLLEDTKHVRAALARLEAIAPERLSFDAEVLWLAADAAARIGTPKEGLSMLLRFTNLFPKDPRRPEALLRAGGIYRELGNSELALQLIDEAIESTDDPVVAVRGRLAVALILEDLGRIYRAREEYKAVISAALDPAPAAQALERLLAIERERRGVDGALMMLASMVHRGDPFVREMARNDFDGLMREINDSLAKDPVRAAFYYELSRYISQERALSPEAQMAAARMLEDVGSYERAGEIYKRLTLVFGPQNNEAASGLARTLPLRSTKGSDPVNPERLASLERDEQWRVILEILRGPRLEGAGSAEHRRLAARARWSENMPEKARELLEALPKAKAEAALLRGDARALIGKWEPACSDYKAARPAYSHGPEVAWLEVRIAACEIRAGRSRQAAQRLETLLARKPQMPASFAAEDLLSRVAVSPAGDTKDETAAAATGVEPTS